VTSYTLTFAKENVTKAVEFLGDILLNSVYNQTQLEAEKERVYRNASENHRDQYKATVEAVHYTAYRDHFISQPVHGIRENLHNITSDQVKQFHNDNYIGKNIVVVGTGNVDTTQFNDAVAKSFGKFPAEQFNAPKNSEKPYFTPSMMFMRDDEMTNINIGVFFQAPTWTDPDFFAMHMFKHIMGDFRSDSFTGQHLNTPDRQYNSHHTEIAGYPDISIQKCNYFHYSDTALFGNYYHGNEVFANQMLFLSQGHLSEFSSYLNQV
jgi:predicted Zn-dependent peptidase